MSEAAQLCHTFNQTVSPSHFTNVAASSGQKDPAAELRRGRTNVNRGKRLVKRKTNGSRYFIKREEKICAVIRVAIGGRLSCLSVVETAGGAA